MCVFSAAAMLFLAAPCTRKNNNNFRETYTTPPTTATTRASEQRDGAAPSECTQTKGRKEGRKEGKKEGWMEGRKDEWMNGSFCLLFSLLNLHFLKTKISKKNNLSSSKENSPKIKIKIIVCLLVCYGLNEINC
jgi:hypothetical protein